MKHVIILTAFLVCFMLLAGRLVSSGPWEYDEADYAFDAHLGWAANYTDSPTLPLINFIRQGLERGRSADARSALSESIRSSNDVIFYRHWHGPLYFYALMLGSGLLHDEHAIRIFSLAFPILSLLIIYFGCVALLPGTEGWIAAILSSALFVFSWTTLASTELAPHQLFASCCLAGLFLLAKLKVTGRPVYLYLASIAAALAFCTLEVTFVLIATILMCAFPLLLDFKTSLRALALFLITVLIVWPGAIVKLSFVKAYLFMAYLAVFRKGAWGNVTVAGTWLQRFANSPVEWILIGVAVALYALNPTLRIRRYRIPFAVFAGLMILATLRVATTAPRYALVFMPALQVFTGLVLAAMLAKRSPQIMTASTAALALSLLTGAWLQVTPHAPGPDQQLVAALNLVRDNHPSTGTLLVPQDFVPSIHYYFPGIHIRGYIGATPSPDETGAPNLTGILYRSNSLWYQRIPAH